MTKRTRTAGRAILRVDIDRSQEAPLAQQIYASIVAAIRDRRLRGSAPLPSTRALARDLSVARSTVTSAFEQLRAEGYIEGRQGRVARIAPRMEAEFGHPPQGPVAAGQSRPVVISRRGERVTNFLGDLASVFLGQPPRPFRSGVPALDVFPVELWGRLLSRAWKRSSPRSLGYGDPQGYLPLRSEIARYLRAARGLCCTEEQVVICSGSQQAIDLAARVLLDEGDAVWFENPGYTIALASLSANGQRIIPVPVDEEGLCVEEGIRLSPSAKLAFVTPARQVPLGIVMSDARRAALVEWAAASGAWVFEDDYDSELQYGSRPPLPLMARDKHGCVLLSGTFSKVLFPALRLGYLVAPPTVARAIAKLKHVSDISSPHLPQAVLTDFMAEGHYERHIRKMRALYQRRQALLVRLLRRRLGARVDVSRAEAGMNLVLWLPPTHDDRAIALAGRGIGLDLIALSGLYSGDAPAPRPGLLLGFGGIRESDLAEGVDKLATLLNTR